MSGDSRFGMGLWVSVSVARCLISRLLEGKLVNDIIWIVSGAINVFIALLHIYIIMKGAPAYRYFGAGEWMAQKAEQGSMLPAAITWGVTAVFFLFALYNFAGAGLLIINLPWLFYGLVGITAIYILRGSVVFTIPFMGDKVSMFDKVSSFAALAIGVLHASGVYLYYEGGV